MLRRMVACISARRGFSSEAANTKISPPLGNRNFETSRCNFLGTHLAKNITERSMKRSSFTANWAFTLSNFLRLVTRSGRMDCHCLSGRFVFHLNTYRAYVSYIARYAAVGGFVCYGVALGACAAVSDTSLYDHSSGTVAGCDLPSKDSEDVDNASYLSFLPPATSFESTLKGHPWARTLNVNHARSTWKEARSMLLSRYDSTEIYLHDLARVHKAYTDTLVVSYDPIIYVEAYSYNEPKFSILREQSAVIFDALALPHIDKLTSARNPNAEGIFTDSKGTSFYQHPKQFWREFPKIFNEKWGDTRPIFQFELMDGLYKSHSMRGFHRSESRSNAFSEMLAVHNALVGLLELWRANPSNETRNNIDETLADYAFLFVNIEPFGTNNWGPFYFLIANVTETVEEAPRFSFSLDILLMMTLSHLDARSLFRAWREGIVERTMILNGHKVKALYRYNQPGNGAPPWLAKDNIII